jgi:2-C-methyl-D-erythritol 2,4-cyclodiphosphate synthase
MEFRVGFGFDVHQIEANRSFWMGGVKISDEFGAVGHSDADVLLHAICDALLGAAALGDIGLHFPNTDPAYKGIDSKVLLERSWDLVREQGWSCTNVDATVVLERPKLAQYVDAMRHEIASRLGLRMDQVSIKATTNEKLGYIGREEGVGAHAVTMLFRPA